MGWTNAFDTGHCTVALYNALGSGTPFWSGLLRKGQSSPQFHDNNGNGPYQIAVDQHGLVTLTNGGTFTLTADMELRVTPNFAISNVACRMRSIYLDTAATADGSGSNSIAEVSNGSIGPTDSVSLTRVGSTNAVTPDPAAPTAIAGVISMSVTARYLAVAPAIGELIGAIYEITTSTDAPLAPDETINPPYNAGSGSPTSITPIITVDSSQVTPDSLVINSLATHGSVGISGNNVQYLPDVGYSGSDSFTYYAMYGGLASNIATVTVNVGAPPSGNFWTDFVTCQEDV